MTATEIKQKIRVHLWDQMVLIGFGLALFYSVFDSILYIFTEYDVDFFQRLLGPDLSEVWSRLTILCLFIIFGSHAQYTINKRKIAEEATVWRQFGTFLFIRSRPRCRPTPPASRATSTPRAAVHPNL